MTSVIDSESRHTKSRLVVSGLSPEEEEALNAYIAENYPHAQIARLTAENQKPITLDQIVTYLSQRSPPVGDIYDVRDRTSLINFLTRNGWIVNGEILPRIVEGLHLHSELNDFCLAMTSQVNLNDLGPWRFKRLRQIVLDLSKK